MLLTDDEFQAFQEELISNPEKGAVIRGTGGFRKIRWGIQGRGKSSGVRVIYYNVLDNGRIYLALLYTKDEQDNLSAVQKAQLKQVTDELK